MDIWKILNIEPTTDKDALKKAYLAKLKVTHPEEKPEEFAMLKEAYELAKQYEEGKVVEKSPFTVELESIYFDFEKRLEIANWKELFHKYLDKNNMSLESLAENKSEVIRDELLTFLMDDYYISTEVWKLIESEFNVAFDKEILSEKFPPNFIDFVVYRIEYGEVFDVKGIKRDGIKTAKEYDEFIRKSNDISRKIRNLNKEEPKELIEISQLLDEVEEMGIPHLSTGINRSIVIGHTIGKEAEEKKLLELFEEYPDNLKITRELGIFYYNAENYESALKYFNMVQEKEEPSDSTYLYIAVCTFYTEDYEKAKQMLYECSRRPALQGSSNFINNLMYQTNIKLVDVMIKRNEESNFSHYANLRSLASCYFNINEYEKAYETIILVPEEDRGEYFYEMYLHATMFTERLDLFKEGLEKYQALEHEEQSDRVGKLVTMYYQKTENYEKALEACNEYIKDIDDEISFAFLKVETLKKLERYDDVLELANRLHDSGKNNFIIALAAAEIYCERRNYNNAFKFTEMANEINHYNSKLQEICMDCRYNFGHYDEVLNLFKFVNDNDLSSTGCDIIAVRAYLEKKEYATALEVINKTIETADDENMPMCVRLKAYTHEMLEDIDSAIQALEEYNNKKFDVGVACSLASLYANIEKYRTGLTLLYNALASKDVMTTQEIEKITYEDVKHKYTNYEYLRLLDKLGMIEYEYNKGFEVAKVLLEKSYEYTFYNIDYYYYYIAHCYSAIGEKEKAIEYFKKNIEQDRGLYYAQDYKRIIGLYSELKDNENIKKMSKKAMELYPDEHKFYDEYLDIIKKEEKFEEVLAIALESVKNENIKKLDKICHSVYEALCLLDREKEVPKYIELFAEQALNREIEDISDLSQGLISHYLDFYQYPSIYGTEKDEKYLEKAKLFAEKIVQDITKQNKNVFAVTKFSQIYGVRSILECYTATGDKAKITFFLKKVMKFIDENKDDCFNYYLAKIYKSMGEYDKALEYGTAASKLNVTDKFCAFGNVCAHSFDVLGDIHFEQGEYEKAIEFFEKYLTYEDSASVKVCIKHSKMLMSKNN